MEGSNEQQYDLNCSEMSQEEKEEYFSLLLEVAYNSNFRKESITSVLFMEPTTKIDFERYLKKQKKIS